MESVRLCHRNLYDGNSNSGKTEVLKTTAEKNISLGEPYDIIFRQPLRRNGLVEIPFCGTPRADEPIFRRRR
jgi:hypothetical protein